MRHIWDNSLLFQPALEKLIAMIKSLVSWDETRIFLVWWYTLVPDLYSSFSKKVSISWAQLSLPFCASLHLCVCCWPTRHFLGWTCLYPFNHLKSHTPLLKYTYTVYTYLTLLNPGNFDIFVWYHFPAGCWEESLLKLQFKIYFMDMR